MRHTEFSERARRLAEVPPDEQRSRCVTVCAFLLVDKTDLRRVWRCEDCLRYIEAPVSRLHEIEWKKEPVPAREALPDQSTIFDLLGE